MSKLTNIDALMAKSFCAGLVDAQGTFYGSADVVLIDDILNAPISDAVEVVRCGKCKHFDSDWTYCGSDVHYCKKHKCAKRESEFCSDGESKGD